MLTIVAYHYVRNLGASRFPKLAARDQAAFERQLDYLARHYQIIGLDDLRACLDDGNALPENACMLTFDDGYRDHVDVAMPALARRGWTGVFFPSANAVVQRHLLDVNAIQFVIAAIDDRATLAAELCDMIEAVRDDATPSLDKLRTDWFAPGRWDDAPTRFIKGVLQQGLPSAQRQYLIAQLFHRHVSEDSVAFADDLYLDQDGLDRLLDAGMCLGSHGACHHRMTCLEDDALEADLITSLAMLEQTGVDIANGWALCYPHGAQDDRVTAMARSLGCRIGVTVEPRLADVSQENPLTLPRLDTNNLPA